MKTTKFQIGHTDKQHRIEIDLLRLIDTRALIQANSGGGKSWLLRLIAERTGQKVQTIILDPEGEFATLREKLDIALVGRDGEIAADPRSAGLLARKLMELKVSAVIDLYDLKLPERRAFVRLFIESLLSVPKALYHPVLVAIDEAHKFAPERGSGESESTAAVIDLASQGRKRGLCAVLLAQRPSKLHKDATAELNNVFVGRCWQDVDRDRAGDLLGMSKADRLVLRDLQPGEFYAFGPALLHNGVMRFHSDAVETTHPKPGERHTLEVSKASAAIREIVQQIGDLPAQAHEEARTLEAAQREVAQLKAQLRTRPVQTQMQIEKVVERVEVPIITDDQIQRLEGALKQIKALDDSLQTNANALGKELMNAYQAILTSTRTKHSAIAPVSQRTPAAKVPTDPSAVNLASSCQTTVNASPRSTRLTQADDTRLPKAERSILTVLAQYPEGRSNVQIAIMTGYAVGGGGFNNALGALRSWSYIHGDKAHLQITDAGPQALGNYEPLPTGRALLVYWLVHLPKAERSILSVVAEVYPSAIDKATLAERAGYEASGGGFNNALGKLRTLELINGRNDLRASDVLYE